MNNNIQKLDIKDINSSPLFNFSLASKELFHSNFLNWLINEYKEEMSQIINETINSNNKVKINNSSQEKRHFDLFIECNGFVIIIENKFKSIVSKEQLIKYNEKIIDYNKVRNNKIKYKILLTLIETKYIENILKEIGNDKSNWIPLNYLNLCKKIENVIPNNDSYHKYLIKDYVGFVKKIVIYFNNILEEKNNGSLSLEEINSEYNNFKKIKLHDIFHKRIFNFILEKIANKFNEKNIHFDIGRDSINEKSISIWQDFTRSTGLVTIRYIIKKTNKKSFWGIELQLQNNDLKYLIIYPENPKQKEKDEWINGFFSFVKKLSKTKNAKGMKLYPVKTNDGFKHYGETVIYKNIILLETLKINEIVSLMIEEFLKLKNYCE